MRIFEIFSIKASRRAIVAIGVTLGGVGASSALAASMTVSPSSPVAKPNATTTVEVKFVGKVLALTNYYPVCPSQQQKCTILQFPVKLYAGNQLITPYSSGPVTCGPNSSSWLSNGVYYDGCDSPVVKVTIPAKSNPGLYNYTVTHDEDTFTNSTTASFVVSVRSGPAISTILPILLD